MTLQEELSSKIRDVPNFPKPGIIFKDITPVLSDHSLCGRIIFEMSNQWIDQKIDVVVGIESRGFLFGRQLAGELEASFVPVRKAGKLPSTTIQESYNLEYGSAILEMHADALQKGQRVLIHDDLLATGGAAEAAAKLVTKAGGVVTGFSFIIELGFLKGTERLDRAGKVAAILSY